MGDYYVCGDVDTYIYMYIQMWFMYSWITQLDLEWGLKYKTSFGMRNSSTSLPYSHTLVRINQTAPKHLILRNH